MDRTVKQMIADLVRVTEPRGEVRAALRFVSGSQVSHRTQETVSFRDSETDAELLCVKSWRENDRGRQKIARDWYVKPADTGQKGRYEAMKPITKESQTGRKAKKGRKPGAATRPIAKNGAAGKSAKARANGKLAFGKYTGRELCRWMGSQNKRKRNYSTAQAVAVCEALGVEIKRHGASDSLSHGRKPDKYGMAVPELTKVERDKVKKLAATATK
jgi:hypothetical protein